MKKLLVYMAIEIGLALLTILGSAVGPLLLWPRWNLSPYANIGTIGGATAAVFLLILAGIYALNILKPISDSDLRLRYLHFAIPFMVLTLIALYFLPATTLPAADPTSKPLLWFGPADEVQMLAWTIFTYFLYLPAALATLFWHVFTIVLVKAYRRQHPLTSASPETAPQRQIAEG